MGVVGTGGTLRRAEFLRRIAASAFVVALFVAVDAVGPALAKGAPTGRPSPSATATPATGNDIAWPQCGGTYPASPAFGIVDLNGGLPNDLNACFAPSSSYPSYTQSELYWALATSTGDTTSGATEPKASIYLNTADPGDVYNNAPIADWPTTGSSPLYGSCTTTTVRFRHKSTVVGANTQACAWVYGHNKALQDLSWLSAAAAAIQKQEASVPVSGLAGGYPWWLDVETGNTWQAGTTGRAMNVAVLQGVVETLRTAGAPSIGIYSTSAQWAQIAGTTTSATAGLAGLPDWVPGASTASGATSNCALASFTSGSVQLTQWTATFDEDHYC